MATPNLILRLPFHSVDATDWETVPCKFGEWRAFGVGSKREKIQVRGSAQNLRAEVEFYLDLERQARQKWAPQMAEISDYRDLRGN
jgi:hypothetical protein